MSLAAAASLGWPFALVLGRVSGVVLTAPFLGAEVIPVRARVALTVAISFALTLALPYAAAPSAPIVALASELLLGAAAGLVVRIAVGALELAGELTGLQMGLGFGHTLDPLLESQGSVVSQAFSLAAGALFFATNGHLQVVRALADSLKAVPAGTVTFDPSWATTLVDAAATMFVTGLRIAAPLAFVLLTSQLAFAMLGRIMPQLNAWGLGFLITIGLGLTGLAVFAPSLTAEVRDLLGAAIGDAAHLAAGQ